MADQSGHKSMDTLRGDVRNAEKYFNIMPVLACSRPCTNNAPLHATSALPPKSCMCGATRHVRFVPIADIV